MSTHFVLSFGLISFLLFASCVLCSSIFLPLNDIADDYSPMAESGERLLDIVGPKVLGYLRDERSPLYYPRTSRNTWFRVSTYQHFVPPKSDDTHNGDHLLRWGR